VISLQCFAHRRAQCTACGDQFNTTLTVLAPCRHVYCRACIVDLVRSAMTDETLMPPRCCRMEIPIRLVGTVLDSDEMARFIAKHREFGTANRLYCQVPECSAFIGEASSVPGESVACPKCGTQMCAYCKIAQHPYWEPCSDDKDVASQLAIELGKQEGWRRCNACKRLIELVYGW
jgi:hypothetical protein